MKTRILVAVASRHGATLDIADYIASILGRRGFDVVSAPVDEVGDVTQFDALVIGSGVYVGHWLSPATTFIRRHAEVLRHKPVWLFSSGPIGDPPQPTTDPIEVADLVQLIGAREHRVFPGRLEKDLLGLGEKVIVGMVHAPSGDFRDLVAVERWANEIAAAIKVPAQVA